MTWGTVAVSTADWLLLTRWTARLGLPLFLIFFVTRRTSPWLLAFAVTHTLHLGALALYLTFSDESRGPLTVAVGGLGYAALYVLALNPGRARQLGVDRIGPWLIFAIFCSSYVGRLLSTDRRMVGAYGVVLLILAAAARAVTLMSTRRGVPDGQNSTGQKPLSQL